MSKKQDTKAVDSVVDANQFVGHLVKFLVEQVRGMNRPWQQMSETEQQRFIELATQETMTSVEQCRTALAGGIRQTLIPAFVDTVNHKKGFIATTLKINEDADGRHELADHRGQHVLIVIDNLQQFISSEGVPVAEKNQGDLPLDGSPEAALGAALRNEDDDEG